MTNPNHRQKINVVVGFRDPAEHLGPGQFRFLVERRGGSWKWTRSNTGLCGISGDDPSRPKRGPKSRISAGPRGRTAIYSPADGFQGGRHKITGPGNSASGRCQRLRSTRPAQAKGQRPTNSIRRHTSARYGQRSSRPPDTARRNGQGQAARRGPQLQRDFFAFLSVPGPAVGVRDMLISFEVLLLVHRPARPRGVQVAAPFSELATKRRIDPAQIWRGKSKGNFSKEEWSGARGNRTPAVFLWRGKAERSYYHLHNRARAYEKGRR